MRRSASLCAALLVLLLGAPAASALSERALQGRLASLMRGAGKSSGAYVEDLTNRDPLYGRRARTQRIPASNEKLYTTVAALSELGPTARMATTALARTSLTLGGTLKGNLYLRGGGDPTLTSAGLEVLAQDLRDAGLTRVTGRVIGDETAFDRRRGPPSEGYRPSADVAPLGALMVNRGFDGARLQADPPAFAATVLARQLRQVGVEVRLRGRAGATPGDALAMATYRSPTVTTLVKAMNVPSDNYIAEMLLKAVGRTDAAAGTTARGAATARTVASEAFGTAPRIVDGSGLSRGDRTSPREVVALLRAKLDDPAFFGSLAVAGVSGTLARRLRSGPARRRCRGKTGTLSDVSALSGYCRTRSGEVVAFSILMNRVGIFTAHTIQDRMVGLISRYGAG